MLQMLFMFVDMEMFKTLGLLTITDLKIVQLRLLRNYIMVVRFFHSSEVRPDH